MPTPGGNTEKSCSIPSGNCQLFAVVFMSAGVLGVVAQRLNKYRKSPSVCACFSVDPPGDFSPVFFSSFFLKDPPLHLSYPRDDRFSQKIYISPRGELRGYYGSTRSPGTLIPPSSLTPMYSLNYQIYAQMARGPLRTARPSLLFLFFHRP